MRNTKKEIQEINFLKKVNVYIIRSLALVFGLYAVVVGLTAEAVIVSRGLTSGNEELRSELAILEKDILGSTSVNIVSLNNSGFVDSLNPLYVYPNSKENVNVAFADIKQ